MNPIPPRAEETPPPRDSFGVKAILVGLAVAVFMIVFIGAFLAL